MKYHILYFLCFVVLIAYGQTDTSTHKTPLTELDKHLYLSTGISYQKQWVGEIGLLYGKEWHERRGYTIGMGGIKLASEFNFSREQFFIAPKLSYELDMLILGLRLNIVDYTNFTYHDFKLTPEIGITALGFVGIYYGVNIPMNTSRLDCVGLHRVTLSGNLDKFHVFKKKK
jgi:hypothetical protein